MQVEAIKLVEIGSERGETSLKIFLLPKKVKLEEVVRDYFD